MANESEVQEKQELEAQGKEEVQPAEGVERTRTGRVYIPRADIYSSDEDYVIIADMPGVDKKSIDITLEKDVLEINGFVDTPPQLKDYDLAYSEYGIGDYQRRFTISDEIARENIKATISNGVLRVHLPKTPETKVRKIPITG